MADSLDDFFAKKDKKRGKDKGKTVFSAEALVRELEEGSKQVEYSSRKENKTSTAIELLGLDADDADWRDFEDVEKRDYTGLKVKEMSLQDQNEEEQRRLISEQSEPTPDSSAWKIKDDPSSATTESASGVKHKADTKVSDSSSKVDTNKTVSSSTNHTEDPTNKKDQESLDSTENKGDKPSAKQAYVPPAGRNLASGEIKFLEPVKLSKSKSSGTRGQGPIPNIQDEQAFPSLG